MIVFFSPPALFVPPAAINSFIFPAPPRKRKKDVWIDGGLRRGKGTNISVSQRRRGEEGHRSVLHKTTTKINNFQITEISAKH